MVRYQCIVKLRLNTVGVCLLCCVDLFFENLSSFLFDCSRVDFGNSGDYLELKKNGPAFNYYLCGRQENGRD